MASSDIRLEKKEKSLRKMAPDFFFVVVAGAIVAVLVVILV